jgi:CO/xanthine dehydrogenase FAD-binding subunit
VASYVHPTRLTEALAALAAGPRVIVAGGTDFCGSYHVVEYATLRVDLMRYLCRRWNDQHGGAERLVRVNLAMVVARVRDAQPKQPAQVVELLDSAYLCEASTPVAGAADHAR